ncbi:Serine/threonine transporter SstT [Dirofilaria immitis]
MKLNPFNKILIHSISAISECKLNGTKGGSLRRSELWKIAIISKTINLQ